VLAVGATQETRAVPAPQEQVSVEFVLALIAASVWLPAAALVPDQPPLARQLVAVGFVDQVSTGAKLPVEDVRFARIVTTPAVCACAAPATTRKSVRRVRVVFFTTFTLPRAPTRSNRKANFCGLAKAKICGASTRQARQ